MSDPWLWHQDWSKPASPRSAMIGVSHETMIDFLSQSGGIAIPASKLIAEGLLFVGNFAITRAFLFRASSIQKPGKG